MQQKASEAESFQVENLNLKVIIENQQEKLQEYENEVTKTKQHMMKLENLIQKIQEDKINESVSYIKFNFRLLMLNLLSIILYSFIIYFQ